MYLGFAVPIKQTVSCGLMKFSPGSSGSLSDKLVGVLILSGHCDNFEVCVTFGVTF